MVTESINCKTSFTVALTCHSMDCTTNYASVEHTKLRLDVFLCACVLKTQDSLIYKQGSSPHRHNGLLFTKHPIRQS